MRGEGVEEILSLSSRVGESDSGNEKEGRELVEVSSKTLEGLMGKGKRNEPDDSTDLERNALALDVSSEKSEGGVDLGSNSRVKDTSSENSSGLFENEDEVSSSWKEREKETRRTLMYSSDEYMYLST